MNTPPENANKSKKDWSKYILYFFLTILFAIVIGLWFVVIYKDDLTIFYNIPLAESLNMDAVAVLVSAVAFLGFLFSLAKQQVTLELQREDLKLTRQEMQDTRAVMETQNAAFELQKFENTFFKMLELLQNIVNEINVKRPGASKMGAVVEKNYTARHAFEYFFKISLDTVKVHDPVVRNNTSADDLLNALLFNYLKLYESMRSDFGHYFRTLYRVFVIIDKHKFSDDKVKDYLIKYEYTSIVRAQLSDYELLVLFLNCLSDAGKWKFKIYINKYAVFKNLPKAELYHPTFPNYYALSAYFKPKNIDYFLHILKEEDFDNILFEKRDEIMK